MAKNPSPQIADKPTDAPQAAPDATPKTASVAPGVANAPPALLSPAAAFPEEKTVTMISPREFFLLLDDNRRVTVKKGPNEIPESLVEHNYLKDHGVTKYDPKDAKKKA